MQHPILQWLGCCDTAYLQMIELHGLVKTFGELRAVDGINLTIPKGEFFAVLAQRSRKNYHHQNDGRFDQAD